MKIRILLASIVIFGMSACAQHLCPTYQNSAIKYHHHQPHPAHHHTH